MLDYFSFVVFSKTLTSSIPSGAIYEPCRHILGQFCPPPRPQRNFYEIAVIEYYDWCMAQLESFLKWDSARQANMKGRLNPTT